MRWAGNLARRREKRNTYRIFVVEPKGKISLGRLRYRWFYNIKMDLREIARSRMGWINLAEGRDQ
jgi:hypothetical protein